MKKVQSFPFASHIRLRLLLMVLLLSVTSIGRAKTNPAATVRVPYRLPSSAVYNNYWMPGEADVTIPLRPVAAKKILADVTLLFTNYYPADFDITLYNVATDEYYYLNVSPYQIEKPFTVPAGVYDINFWPNDQGLYHHYYSVGCGYSGGGIGSYNMYGVNITTDLYCNYISIE